MLVIADDLECSDVRGVPRLKATESRLQPLRTRSSDELFCERVLTADLTRSRRAIDGGSDEVFSRSIDLMRFCKFLKDISIFEVVVNIRRII